MIAVKDHYKEMLDHFPSYSMFILDYERRIREWYKEDPKSIDKPVYQRDRDTLAIRIDMKENGSLWIDSIVFGDMEGNDEEILLPDCDEKKIRDLMDQGLFLINTTPPLFDQDEFPEDPEKLADLLESITEMEDHEILRSYFLVSDLGYDLYDVIYEKTWEDTNFYPGKTMEEVLEEKVYDEDMFELHNHPFGKEIKDLIDKERMSNDPGWTENLFEDPIFGVFESYL